MLRYLSDYKRESVLAPLFKMLEATFDLFVPLVMADIVNVGIAAHDFHYILVRCGILLLLAIIGLTCSLTAQYFSAKAAVGYSTGLRHALFEHIQTLSFSEMDTMGTSTLITRMTSDVNQVQSGLNLFLRLFLRSPFVVIGAMIMAFTVNFRAALIFVVAIPLLSIVVFGVMVITRPLYKSVQTCLDRVLGLTRENLTGVRVVRAFDKEKSEVDRFEDANELLTQMQLHVGHISALMNPLTYVIINLAIVALLYVGSIEISIGGMASGDVIALVNYMNQILVELVKLANLIVQVSKALACAGRVQAVLDTKPGMEFPAELTGNVPAEKADEVLRRYWVRRMYRKTSGNPLIMRALGILAGALTAAEAASPMLPSGFVRWLLLAVIFVLGGVLFAVIQYAPAAYYQGKWPLAGLAAACAAALLAMAQLGEGVLVMLLVIACEVLIGVLTLHGGRRTAFGDEIVAQTRGYRKFLRRVTQSQLQSRLAQDSQYFYRILPYAEAMGLGRSLARTLGDTALEQCDWYQGAKPVPRTAAGFYSSLREALSLMEMSIRN